MAKVSIISLFATQYCTLVLFSFPGILSMQGNIIRNYRTFIPSYSQNYRTLIPFHSQNNYTFIPSHSQITVGIIVRLYPLIVKITMFIPFQITVRIIMRLFPLIVNCLSLNVYPNCPL